MPRSASQLLDTPSRSERFSYFRRVNWCSRQSASQLAVIVRIAKEDLHGIGHSSLTFVGLSRLYENCFMVRLHIRKHLRALVR